MSDLAVGSGPERARVAREKRIPKLSRLMSDHYLVPGSFFTSEQWHGPLASHVARLVAHPGGVLLVSVEVAPDRRNYPSVSFGVFDVNERKALRAALERCRLKRQKIKEGAKG